MEYHVSKRGSDRNNGTAAEPFLTISRAAELADAGDRVIVHEGVYRECVSPAHGAATAAGRIVYEAAEGEKAVIKGSEVIKNWRKDGSVWRAVIPNSIFGDYNPYSLMLDGDWFMSPIGVLHTGAVYINGRPLTEARGSIGSSEWSCEVTETETVIYADFGGEDPNECVVEINVRASCFAPKRTGVNYITVRGFEMAHGASQWAPPTAEQPGMIFTNWSKGWIIENNELHHARCSAISVGKERATGHNLATTYMKKAGYQTQLETVFAARHIGWSRERIGGHIIRNNTIHDCGQNAIVGHMGGAFSEIYGNHIYNIGREREFFGYEIAGIKLHAAIDTKIYNNCIHHCTNGTWLDWQAQGTRVSANLYFDNDTDLFIEVSHGPYMVDNNIFASPHSLLNVSQGGAYVHNLFCGGIRSYGARNRSTPYHLPHSTEIRGCAVVYGGDDRFIQNIFVGGDEDNGYIPGTERYNGHTASIEEYSERMRAVGRGDIGDYQDIPDPVYISGNCYMAGAKGFDREENKVETEHDPKIRIIEENGRFYIEADIPGDVFGIDTKLVHTADLPLPRISDLPYENSDGTELVIDKDFFGNVRNARPVPGPFEGSKVGKQRFLVL